MLLIRAHWVVLFKKTSPCSTCVCPPWPPHLLLSQLRLHLPFPLLCVLPILCHTCHQLSLIPKCCCFPLFPLPAGFPLLSLWFSDGHHGNWLQMVGGLEHCVGWVGFFGVGTRGNGMLRCLHVALLRLQIVKHYCCHTLKYVHTVYVWYICNT